MRDDVRKAKRKKKLCTKRTTARDAKENTGECSSDEGMDDFAINTGDSSQS